MRVFLRLTLSTACFVLLLGQDACKFHKDNSDGRIPPVSMPSDRTITVTHTNEIPQRLTCDALYYTARAEERVETCANYSFQRLYEMADDDAADQVESVANSCPGDCPFPKATRVSQHWECGGTPAVASATVTWAEQCVPTADTAIPGFVATPTSDALGAPRPQPAPPAPGPDAILVERKELPHDTSCRPPEAIRFEYRVGVAKRPPSLEEYVLAAEASALRYWEGIDCAPTCKKLAFRIHRREWSWDAGVVLVVLYLMPCDVQ